MSLFLVSNGFFGGDLSIGVEGILHSPADDGEELPPAVFIPPPPGKPRVAGVPSVRGQASRPMLGSFRDFQQPFQTSAVVFAALAATPGVSSSGSAAAREAPPAVPGARTKAPTSPGARAGSSAQAPTKTTVPNVRVKK